MTQTQFEHRVASDTTQAELERARAFVIRQVESSTDMVLLDLIAKLLLSKC